MVIARFEAYKLLQAERLHVVDLEAVVPKQIAGLIKAHNNRMCVVVTVEYPSVLCDAVWRKCIGDKEAAEAPVNVYILRIERFSQHDKLIAIGYYFVNDEPVVEPR